MTNTTYPIELYNSTCGSLVLLHKILDSSVPVYESVKKMEMHKETMPKLVKSYRVFLYNLIKNRNDIDLVEYDTIRGPIYRLRINGVVLPLREDGFPDPSFITHSKYKVLADEDFKVS